MTHNLSIAVDIDDVLFPWYDNAHRASQAAGIAPEGITPVTWQPYDEYDCTAEQWWEVLRAATYDGTLYLGDPYPGAIGALWEFERAGHAIHLVTARGTHKSLDPEVKGLIEAATVRWLAEHHAPYDSLTFSHDKTIVPADYAVDDNINNYDALEAAGVAVWLIDQPWNRDGADKQVRRRVNSLSEFADIVLAKEAVLV